VLGRRSKKFLHVRSFGVCWPHGIPPFRQSNTPVHSEVNDRFHTTNKTVNMARRVIE
jgi:hypothetical protein